MHYIRNAESGLQTCVSRLPLSLQVRCPWVTPNKSLQSSARHLGTDYEIVGVIQQELEGRRFDFW